MSEKGLQFSVRKLAEYCEARPGRQLAIIRDQKYPSIPKVRYYNSIEDRLGAFVLERDRGILTTHLQKIEASVPRSRSEAQVKICQIAALESLLDFPGLIQRLGEFDAEFPPAGKSIIQVRRLPVSVRPTAILRRTGKQGSVTWGAIKFVFAKSASQKLDNRWINTRTAGYIATGMHRKIAQLGKGKVDPRICLIVDVFAKRIFEGPNAVVRYWRDLEAAADQIWVLWSSVGPSNAPASSQPASP